MVDVNGDSLNEVSDRPNVLLIISDEHRFDCLGAYGNSEIRTPFIDNLAKEGVLYENSFCSSPVCTPSRYSILTGLYPHQHMGWSNHCTIPNGLDTFPRIFKQGGYRTKAIGKMHYSPTYLDVGYEQMELAEQNGDGRYDDDYHRFLYKRGKYDQIDLLDQVKEFRDQASEEYWKKFGAIESNLTDEEYSTTWIGESALQSLREWKTNDKNLLTVSFIKPHHPFDPPVPWSQMYNPQELTPLPGWVDECLACDLDMNKGFFPHANLTREVLQKIMAYYYATITQIDHYVGKMIEILKQKGLYENTVVVYTSDHGEYMGYHHMLLKGNYMYEPLVKVPLIIKYPNSKQVNKRSTQLVNNIDLAPTLLGQAGLGRGKFMAGRDIAGDQQEPEFVFSEIGAGNQYMIRSNTRKLILCRNDQRSSFFNLASDPLEMKNLYLHPDYQAEILEYKTALLNWSLFKAVTPIHLDESAPQIERKQIREEDNEQRETLRRWFREKMQEMNSPGRG